MGKRKTIDETYIYELWDAGFTAKEIANKANCSTAAAYLVRYDKIGHIEPKTKNEMRKIKVSTHHVLEIDREKSDGMYITYRNVPYSELEEALKLNDTYQNLKHLCDVLGELQVEVQTPDVEIKDKP